MSSYEELVQEPMRATFSSEGQPFFTTSSLNLEIGVARSGVKGPLICGSNSDKFCKKGQPVIAERLGGKFTISTTWSYSAPSSARKL